MIKTWDDRLTELGVDSGVDDEVSVLLVFSGLGLRIYTEGACLCKAILMEATWSSVCENDKETNPSSSSISRSSSHSDSEPSSSSLRRLLIRTDRDESGSTPISRLVQISQTWRALHRSWTSI